MNGSRTGLTWMQSAVREEAAAEGCTAAMFVDCPAWKTLARCAPVLSREKLDDFRCIMLDHRHHLAEAAPEEWSDKEIALRTVVGVAASLIKDCPRSLTEAKLEAEVETRREYAAQLRAIAENLWPPVLKESHAANLEAAARDCEAFVAKYIEMQRSTPGLVTRRNQSDPRVRGYCVELAETMRIIYGTTLRGTLATIATCALGLRVPLTARTIRDWIPDRGVS